VCSGKGKKKKEYLFDFDDHVIHAVRRNKIQGTPITSFSIRPFHRWRSGRAELFGKALFFHSSSQLPRRIDCNRNAQRTINHCIPKRNSYAVTSIKMRLLKSNRSFSHFPKSSRVLSGLPVATNIRLSIKETGIIFFSLDKSING